MPYLAISCGLDADTAEFKLRRYYVEALQGVGLGAAILPPPDLPRAAMAEPAEDWAERLDGLLLSGGGDFRPQLWGEYPHDMAAPKMLAMERLRRREDWELALLAAFMRRRKPVLGICRGMQLLNVGLGGSLWQDLAERPDSREHWQAEPPEQTSHLVHCRGRLAEWLGAERLAVNSLHHQAVRRLGQGLGVWALAADGVIEAIGRVSRNSFILGVQWHPERLADAHNQGIWRALAENVAQ